MSNVGTPTPKMANKETQHPELTIRSSSLLHELTSLPLVGSLGSLYTRTRDSHWVLKRGFGVFEDACSIVLDRLHIGSAMAIQMDKAAGEGVTKLKRRYPSITVPTEEMVQTGKDNAKFLFHKTIRKIFRTYPGQITFKVFDWSVDKADGLLHQVSPAARSPRKRKVTRASVKRIQKEQEYESEDSGACDSTEPKEPIPAEAEEVSNLKKVRRYLRAVSQKKRKPERSCALSPEKEAEIEARRKVSPRKRKPMSLLDQVRLSAFSVFGYKGGKVRHILIEKSEGDIKTREEAERKRKHDEILTDQGSASEESNDDDLAEFDFDNYESEDDPDYEPSESDAISEDISDGETESDIECETAGESPFIQIKEKRVEEKAKEPQHQEKKDLPKPCESISEIHKDAKAEKDDKKKLEKIPEVSKDTKAKVSEPKEEKKKREKAEGEVDDKKKSEKVPEVSKDVKATSSEPKEEKKKLEKAEGEVDDEKKSEKVPEVSKDVKATSSEPRDGKKSKKSRKSDDKSKEQPKDAQSIPPQSDKLPEQVVNGGKADEKSELKFGKYFDK